MGTVMRSLYEVLGLFTPRKRIWAYRQALRSWKPATLSNGLAILFAAMSVRLSQTLRQLDCCARAQLGFGGEHG